MDFTSIQNPWIIIFSSPCDYSVFESKPWNTLWQHWYKSLMQKQARHNMLWICSPHFWVKVARSVYLWYTELHWSHSISENQLHLFCRIQHLVTLQRMVWRWMDGLSCVNSKANSPICKCKSNVKYIVILNKSIHEKKIFF